MSGNQEFYHHDLANSLDLSVLQWNPRLTRRGFMAAAAGAAAAAWLAACGSQSTPTTQAASLGTKLEGSVHLYNWQAYINPDNVKAFEQQFGQKVTQDFYVSNEDLLAKLQAGAKGYDMRVSHADQASNIARPRVRFKLGQN